MRELKFRAWDKTKGKMIYAEEAKNSRDLLAIGLHGLPIAVDRDSFQGSAVVGWNIDHHIALMQYIGLKDKNGREIYEGDIIIADWHWTEPHKVVWPDDYYWLDEVSLEGESMEVIGNVHQNPEMQANPLQGNMQQQAQGGQ